MHTFFIIILVHEVRNCVFQAIKFHTFLLSKYSVDENEIRDKGGVALGEALKVNMTLQTLR